MMSVPGVFLEILRTISDVITQLFSLLPNPDPFPAVIESIDVSTESPTVIAYFWLNNFVDVPFIVGTLTAYFTMFGVAWIIMMLWKWLKAR